MRGPVLEAPGGPLAGCGQGHDSFAAVVRSVGKVSEELEDQVI